MNLNCRKTLHCYSNVYKIVLLENLFAGTLVKYIFKKGKIHPQLPYLLKCQLRPFPHIWHLNVWGCFNFTYKALNQTSPNQSALNWTLQSKTKACTTKSSHVNEPEKTAQLKVTETIFSFMTMSIIFSFKKQDTSESSCVSIFRLRST